MKLKLNRSLRAALMACYAITAPIATTVSTGALLTGAIVLNLAPQAMAEGEEITDEEVATLSPYTADGSTTSIMNATFTITSEEYSYIIWDAPSSASINYFGAGNDSTCSLDIQVKELYIDNGSGDRIYNFTGSISDYVNEDGTTTAGSITLVGWSSTANNQDYYFKGDMSGWSGTLTSTGNSSGYGFSIYITGDSMTEAEIAASTAVSGTGSIYMNAANESLNYDFDYNATIGNTLISATTLNFSGGVNYTVNSTVTAGTINIAESTNVIISAGETLTVTGSVSGGGSSTLDVDGTLTLSSGASITASSTLTLDLSGTVVLSEGGQILVSDTSAITFGDDVVFDLSGVTLVQVGETENYTFQLFSVAGDVTDLSSLWDGIDYSNFKFDSSISTDTYTIHYNSDGSISLTSGATLTYTSGGSFTWQAEGGESIFDDGISTDPVAYSPEANLTISGQDAEATLGSSVDPVMLTIDGVTFTINGDEDGAYVMDCNQVQFIGAATLVLTDDVLGDNAVIGTGGNTLATVKFSATDSTTTFDYTDQMAGFAGNVVLTNGNLTFGDETVTSSDITLDFNSLDIQGGSFSSYYDIDLTTQTGTSNATDATGSLTASGTGTTATFGGAVDASSISISDSATATFTGAVDVSGTITLSGSKATFGSTVDASSISISDSATATFTGAVDATTITLSGSTATFGSTVDATTISINSGGTYTFNGVVGGDGAINITGTDVSAYTLTFNADASINQWIMDSGASTTSAATTVTLNLGTNVTLSLTQFEGGYGKVLGDLDINFDSGSNLKVTNSIWVYSDLNLVSTATANSDGIVEGGSMTIAGLFIGYSGTAAAVNVGSDVSLTITGSSTGSTVATNCFNISGTSSGSTLNISGSVIVQNAGISVYTSTSSGTINVKSGGSLQLDVGLLTGIASGCSAYLNVESGGTLILGNQADETADYSAAATSATTGLFVNMKDGSTITDNGTLDGVTVATTLVYAENATVNFVGSAAGSLTIVSDITNAVYDADSGEKTAASTVSAIISGNVTFAGDADLAALTVSEGATLTISGDYVFNSAIDNSGTVSILEGASLDITGMTLSTSAGEHSMVLVDGDSEDLNIYADYDIATLFTAGSWDILNAANAEDVSFVDGVLYYTLAGTGVYWNADSGAIVDADGAVTDFSEYDITIDTTDVSTAELNIAEGSTTLASLTISGNEVLTVQGSTADYNALTITNALTISADVKFDVDLTADSMTINSGTTTLSESISITNALTVAEGATLRLEANDILLGAGSVSLAGTLQLGSEVTALDGTQFTVSGGSLNIDLDGAEVTLSNASSVNDSSTYAINLTGEGSLSDADWSYISSTGVSVAEGTSLVFTASSNTTSKTISGAGDIEFNVTGSSYAYVTMSDFTGTLTQTGTNGLVLGNNTEDSRFALVVNSAVVLQTGNTTTYLNSLSGSGNILVSNGSNARYVDLQMEGDNVFSGTFVNSVSSSTYRFGGLIVSSESGEHYSLTLDGTGYTTAVTTAANNSLEVSNADVILTNGAKWEGYVNLNDSTSTLIFNDLSSSYERTSSAGTIAGSGSVEIDGSNVTFSLANTYTGGTSVIDAGTLTVGADSALGTGMVTATGIGASVTVNSGITLGNDVTLNNTATLVVGSATIAASADSTATIVMGDSAGLLNNSTTSTTDVVGSITMTGATVTGAALNVGTDASLAISTSSFDEGITLSGGSLVAADGTLSADVSVTAAGSTLSATELNSTITLSDDTSLALSDVSSLGDSFVLDLSAWDINVDESYEIITGLSSDISSLDNWNVTVDILEGYDTVWDYADGTLTLSYVVLADVIWDSTTGSIINGSTSNPYSAADITIDTTDVTDASLNAAVGNNVASLAISGTNALTIDGDTGLVVSGAMTIADAAVTVDSGTGLDVDSIAVNSGSLTVDASDLTVGTLTVSGGAMTINGVSDAETTTDFTLTDLKLSSGSLTVGDNITITDGTTGALTTGPGTNVWTTNFTLDLGAGSSLSLADRIQLVRGYTFTVTGSGEFSVTGIQFSTYSTGDGSNLVIDAGATMNITGSDASSITNQDSYAFMLGFWAGDTTNEITVNGTLNVENAAMATWNGSAIINVGGDGTLNLGYGLDLNSSYDSKTSVEINVNGGTLQLGDGDDEATNDQLTVTMTGGTIEATEETTVYQAISYSGAVTFDGTAGLLTMASAVSNASGTATIEGDVAFTAGSSLAGVTMVEGSTLSLSGDYTYALNSVTGSGTVSVGSGTTLGLTSNLGEGVSVSLTGSLELGSGVTALDGSAVTLSDTSSLDINLDGATVTLSNASSINDSSTYAINLTGEGTLTGADWTYISSTGVSVAEDASLVFTASSNTTSKTISGAGDIEFNVTGSSYAYVTMSDFTGTLTQTGTNGLVLGNNTEDSRFALVVNSAVVLQSGDTTTYLNSLSGSGNILVSNGSNARYVNLQMEGDNVFSGAFVNSVSGSTYRFGGLIVSSESGEHYSLTLDGTGYTTSVTTAANNSLEVSNADVILTDGAKWEGYVNLNDSTATLIFKDLTSSYERTSSAGTIAGSGSVEIDGSNVTFSLENTYTGSTSVSNAGTLTMGEGGSLVSDVTINDTSSLVLSNATITALNSGTAATIVMDETETALLSSTALTEATVSNADIDITAAIILTDVDIVGSAVTVDQTTNLSGTSSIDSTSTLSIVETDKLILNDTASVAATTTLTTGAMLVGVSNVTLTGTAAAGATLSFTDGSMTRLALTNASYSGGSIKVTGVDGFTITNSTLADDTSMSVEAGANATITGSTVNGTVTLAAASGDYSGGQLTISDSTFDQGIILAGGSLIVNDDSLTADLTVTAAGSSLSASELDSTITLNDNISLALTGVTGIGDEFVLNLNNWTIAEDMSGSYTVFTDVTSDLTTWADMAITGLDYSTNAYELFWEVDASNNLNFSFVAISSDDPWASGTTGEFSGSPEEEYVFDTTEGSSVVIGEDGATTAGAEFEGGGDIEISGEGTFTSTDDITVVGGTDVTISTTVTVTDGAESTDAGTLAVDNGTVTVATGGSINADITLGVAAGEEEGATATTGKVAAGILTVEGTGASITDGTLEVDKLAGGEVAKATVTVDASLVAGHADGIATLDGATIGADSTLEVKADSTLELTNGAEVAANTTLAADASVTAGLITLTGNKDGGSVTYSNGGSLTTTTHTNATISNTTVTFGQAAATQGGSVAAILGGNALLAGATYEDEVTTTGDHYTNGSTIAVLTGADLTLKDVIIDADTTVTQEDGSAITIAGESTLYANTSSNLTVATDATEGVAATTTTLTITTFASCSDVTATGILNLNITLNDTDWSQFIDGVNTEDYITNVVLTNVDGGTITSEELLEGLTVIVNVNNATYGGGFDFAPVSASYDDYGSLVLTIPEPSTSTLSLLALAGLLARRRRSREA